MTREKEKETALILAVCAILAASLWWTGCNRPGPKPRAADTVRVETRVDTIIIREPQPPDTVTIVRYVTARLPIAAPTSADTDTSAAPTDTAEVTIPITQAVYADSLYTAYVSGWQPRLDSIAVYQRTRTVTIERAPAPPPRRWGIGIQAGYGITPAGPQPYLGIGVALRIY